MRKSIKVNSLNPFDRKFFGKSFAQVQRRNNQRVTNSKNLSLNSYDDFSSYFNNRVFSVFSQKVNPKADVVVKS